MHNVPPSRGLMAPLCQSDTSFVMHLNDNVFILTHLKIILYIIDTLLLQCIQIQSILTQSIMSSTVVVLFSFVMNLCNLIASLLFLFK